MMNVFFNYVKSYTRDLLAENADNLNMFEIRPGIYSSIDPARLTNCAAADFDLSLNYYPAFS